MTIFLSWHRYRTLKHGKQPVDVKRFQKLSRASQRMDEDGLSSLEYNLVELREWPLYTNVTVGLKKKFRAAVRE